MKRGIIFDIPENVIDKMFLFSIWLWVKLNRYKLPLLLIISVTSGGISFYYKDISAFIAGVVFYELFLLSVAVHEACHMKCASMFNVKSDRIMVIFSEFGVRIGFDKNAKMTELEFNTVLLSGPLTPLIFYLPILIVSIICGFNAVFIIIFIACTAIDIMSLLPLTNSDGARVYKFIKSNHGNAKLLFVTYLIFFLWNIKLFNIKE